MAQQEIVAKNSSDTFSILFVVVLVAAVRQAPAAGIQEPLDLLEEQAFRAAVERVAPSVVRIETVGGSERVGRIEFGAGPTSGLVVSADGYIVSSAFNFVNRPSSILVQLPDETRKPAKLVATDHNRMLVLLKIEPDAPLAVPEAVPPEQIRVGQWAIAVGRTFPGNQPNVAVGIVSARNRIWGKAIQTDAAVSPNNYGGPLVDIRGRVLGVLMPMSPDAGDKLAGLEWYDSGIGFAVPLHDILDVLPRLQQGDDLYPGLLGISLAKGKLYADTPVIAAVRPNSPAFKAGLKSDDRIAEIDGRPVDRLVELKAEIARRYAGDTLRLVVRRDDQRIAHEVQLVARLEPYQRPFLGVLPMRPGSKEGGAARQGVAIRYVYPDSPAAKAGLKPGDMLMSFAAEAILDAEQLRRRISEKSPGDTVELAIRREESDRTIATELAALPEDLPGEPLPPADSRGSDAVGKADEPGLATPPRAKSDARGMFKMKLPEYENDAWVYVPQRGAAPEVYGLVVWLHAPGGLDEKALLERWKPHCDRGGLILLAPKSADPDRWQPGELPLIQKLMKNLAVSHSLDPSRITVCGREGGGTMAYLVAFQEPESVSAVVTADAPLLGRVPQNEPSLRLAFYVAKASESAFARRVDSAIERLRAEKYPVTVKSLGADSRELNDEELAELVRWIDTLDRI